MPIPDNEDCRVWGIRIRLSLERKFLPRMGFKGREVGAKAKRLMKLLLLANRTVICGIATRANSGS